ncbi:MULTISPECIES: DUF2756 family protein [Buttiauxella]|uniref:Outer membrane protein n=1 Tax=Buttiauxella ferragutiae ATCC 51602 TaxID=1354252 RepID=A0ABX2WBK4_9ENTR|nr:MULTISPECIES: DUF2756 family protein [Buttiauxella]AYN28394.1 DUF2756 family protein [Buttiauxella sp. 3AFRM03]MCE0828324.1 DUF2756 family protein [Buttiauxella ferragutiae]OAT30279.1 hypothetical protein M976_01054 [Buttiauxella ferragutiae ATCC 51602]TDN52827.1 uncharacterized protein DUF2756 [Buttiauxella sp. JUb87]UNK61532.1 DUF2756 family protein [Buttiauxella ferragutiae]
MKKILMLAALLPLTCLAQPINTLNNPNQQGYQIPSQQRMQQQMQTQQIQQKGMLNQQLQTQTRVQQQHLESQINNNSQGVFKSTTTPANELDVGTQQVLPNTNGGMLNSSATSSGQQHMLQPTTNGSMLNPGTH